MTATLLQQAKGLANGGSTITVTLGTATGNSGAGGTALVVYFGSRAVVSPPTVSTVKLGGSADNFGATAANKETGTAVDQEIWLDLNCATGQTSVVVTLSSGSIVAWASVEEWAGFVTSAGLDAHPAGANAGSSATFTSNSTGTLAQAGEIALASVGGYAFGEVISGPASPWTNTSISGVTSFPGLTGYQLAASTSALTYSGTFSPNAAYACCVITVKLQPGTTVSLPVLATTDNVPALTQPPVVVNLPALATTAAVAAAAPASPPTLVIAITSLASVSDPLAGVVCLTGYTVFQINNVTSYVNINNNTMTFVTNGNAGSPAQVAGGVVQGVLFLASGGTTGLDQEGSMVLQSRSSNAGTAIANAGGDQLQFNGQQVTVP